tara:strand:+ start:516 stop:1955 length:1440 start_codon:yes stop_codon:yes gene_type:complete
MEFLVSGLVVAAALGFAGYFAMSRTRGLTAQLVELQAELAGERERANVAEASAHESGARIGEIGAQLAETKEARERLAAELEDAKEARRTAEKDTALARQEIETMRASMENWDKTKDEAMKAARDAMFSTATDLSNKLLEDHKREAKAAKEEGEKRVQEASGKLLTQFETLSKTVASLNDQVTTNKDAVDVIERALSNPASAGFAAETVLENTLKSFGLTAGTDFVLQRTFGAEDGGRLRPDAIVFLPADSVLVIDSKASKFLIELAQAEDDAAEAAVNKQLADTMSQHLKSLASKNYRSAVQADFRAAGKGEEVKQLISIMWLPNDAAVEKVLRADPEFQRKASENGIFVVGPTGLWTAVGVAGSKININKQAENHEKIVETVHTLIERLVVVLGHAGRVGSGLKTAVDSYEKLSRSINSRLLPPVRNLVDLGVEAPTKGLPKPMPEFEVRDTDRRDAIDAEVDTLDNVRELPLPAGE